MSLSTKIQCALKFVSLVFLVSSSAAFAELTIFDVRRTLPMSDTDKVFRDFYINGGTESGVNVGLIITVQRRLPLYDTYSNRSAGDLDLKVGRIRIIHAQKGLAVARLANEFDYTSAPLLEDNFIMVGDRLNLATAVSENAAKKAEVAPSQPEPAAVEPALPTPAAPAAPASPEPTAAPQAPTAPAKVSEQAEYTEEPAEISSIDGQRVAGKILINSMELNP